MKFVSVCIIAGLLWDLLSGWVYGNARRLHPTHDAVRLCHAWPPDGRSGLFSLIFLLLYALPVV